MINKMIDDIIDRIRDMRAESKKLVLVIDKGCTSKDVITKVKDKIGIVSSLKRSDVPELMKLSLAQFTLSYTLMQKKILSWAIAHGRKSLGMYSLLLWHTTKKARKSK